MTNDVGYHAPPLDGIWATAPYLHNGSVPTLQTLLDPQPSGPVYSAPFDRLRALRHGPVGWKYNEVKAEELASTSKRSRFEAKFIVDTSRFGLGNPGHAFGDQFTESHRGRDRVFQDALADYRAGVGEG